MGIMARMYGKSKGLAQSAQPFKRTPPSWLKLTPSQIEEEILTLARKGLHPTQIGAKLRDVDAIPLTRFATGKSILRILKKHGVNPNIPEDLFFLMKRTCAISKHRDNNKRDKDAAFRLNLCESRIARLIRYYSRTKQIPNNFKYRAATARAIVGM